MDHQDGAVCVLVPGKIHSSPHESQGHYRVNVKLKYIISSMYLSNLEGILQLAAFLGVSNSDAHARGMKTPRDNTGLVLLLFPRTFPQKGLRAGGRMLTGGVR